MLNYLFSTHLPRKHLYMQMFNTVTFMHIRPLQVCSFYALSCLNHNCLIQIHGSMLQCYMYQTTAATSVQCQQQEQHQPGNSHTCALNQLYHQSNLSASALQTAGVHTRNGYTVLYLMLDGGGGNLPPNCFFLK